jgi:hypothetical protein
MRTNNVINIASAMSQMGIPGVNVSAGPKPSTTKPITEQINTFVRPKVMFKETLDAYRVFIANYNDSVVIANTETEHYNDLVSAYKKQNQPNAKLQKEIQNFQNDNSSTNNNRAYNSMVVEFNNKFGFYLKKRKIQTVKPATELYFSAFLHEYSCYLQTVNNVKDKASITSATTLVRLKINPNNIINQMRNGVQNLNVCTKTIRHHRQRLEECGVLLDYQFHSRKRPISCIFNLQILSILDEKNSKSQITQNQPLNANIGKEFPHTNVSTRTIINEIEKKEKVNNISQLKDLSFQSTKVDNQNKNQNTNTPKDKKLTIEKQTRAAEFSEKLREKIDTTYDLSQKLANNEYDYHAPIPMQHLLYECRYGNLTDDEFRSLVIQDFFKTSAKLWQNNTPFAGSWYNAIEFWDNDMFKTFTGKIFDKTTTLEALPEYRHRLNYAYKWFKKHKWEGVNYPNLYFDPTRNKPEHVSFGFTKKVWLDKIKKNEKYQSQKKQRAAKNERMYKEQRLFKTSIRKYIKKQYNLQQLIDFVKQNLPPQYTNKLPEALQKMNIQLLNN